MALFTTLYSGSSGNCALILHEGKYLLIDMGKSCRTTLNALRSLGLAVSDCEGILITHEHSDHVSGLDTFFKHYSVPVYGCADTLDTLYSRGTIPPALDAIAMDGRTEDIGTFRVSSFPTSHDVPCCGYRVTTPDGHIMALATDLGVLTPVVQENLAGCSLVALEANYDSFSLHGGPYPYYLKVRIASDRGHLDNRACAAELLDLIQDGCKKFALCHLSQTNNSPELALTTVYNVLLAAGIQPGRDVLIQAEERTGKNTGLHLNIAINYGGRDEIKHATQEIAKEVQTGVLSPESITEQTIADHLYTAGLPDVDLLIRPSGELRLSNYLIWQCAYAEYYFTNVLWPDFHANELNKALADYAQRGRRFGGI